MKAGDVRMETTYLPEHNGVYLLLEPTVKRGSMGSETPTWIVLVLSDATWPNGMTLELNTEWLALNTESFA